MPLYSFTSATFTPGGATFRTGPTLAQAVSGLTGTGVDAWKNNTTYFNTSNGIQLWKVPATGVYTIDCYGAQGGRDGYYSVSGGLGARIKGSFSLTEGQILRLVVGQQGQNDQGNNWGGGGGGGTFVWIDGQTTNPLIAAGGGGTGGTGGNATQAGGQTGTAGSAGQNNGGAGGTGGNASASTGICGGGGGQGWLGGSSYHCGGSFTWPALYTDPTGYLTPGANAQGGFGGGGGSYGGGGGGGGYSGGGSGGWNYSGYGGGGGSYNAGTDQTNTAATRTGDGYIVITSTVVPDGLSANSQSAASGETLTITFTSAATADNTLVPYTITGVNSSDINGASLTGNFTVVNKTASVSFLISTSAKKTLTFTSNGFTQTVSLLENRYGLVVLNETQSITSTFQDLPIVNLTSIEVLTNVFVLQPGDTQKLNLGDSTSVLLGANSLPIVNFASVTSFNSADNVSVVADPQQYWIG